MIQRFRISAAAPSGASRKVPPRARGTYTKFHVAAGFTLLELIIVILLLTILLGFAIPAFQRDAFTGSRENVARELLITVKKLKIAALSRQSIHTLYMNLDESLVWVTREETAAEEEAPARESEWILPDDTRIAYVRFPDKREIQSGIVALAFYPQGYSDRALVRLIDDANTHTDIVIEAFLPMALIDSENDPIAF